MQLLDFYRAIGGAVFTVVSVDKMIVKSLSKFRPSKYFSNRIKSIEYVNSVFIIDLAEKDGSIDRSPRTYSNIAPLFAKNVIIMADEPIKNDERPITHITIEDNRTLYLW